MADLTKEYVAMFKNWSDFEGKSNVRDFWMPFLINFIISAVLQALGQSIGLFSIISYFYGLVIIIPFIALGIRRLHDIGKSGWNLLWVFLIIIGWIYLVYLLAQKSQ